MIIDPWENWFIWFSFWLSEYHNCNWVIPLIHTYKIQKQFYLKLPSIFVLQPQRVSWSDNKLAPLSGNRRLKLKINSLGDDIDPALMIDKVWTWIGCNHLSGDSMKEDSVATLLFRNMMATPLVWNEQEVWFLQFFKYLWLPSSDP